MTEPVMLPPNSETLGQPTVEDAIATMQRDGGWSGLMVAGLITATVPDYTGGGQFPPHFEVLIGGQTMNGYVCGGKTILPGFNDFGVGQWVLCAVTGRVVTLILRLEAAGVLMGLLAAEGAVT